MENGASFGIEVSPHDTVNADGIRKTLYTTISAVLYVLDFASNVYVAIQYYDFDYPGKTFEGIQRGSNNYQGKGIFITMVSVMALGHISCGIVFMLVDLPAEKHPLQLAYFLPFVQLRRALCSLFNCLSKGNRPTAEEKRAEARVEALYSIVSATTDGGPLFLMQYLALVVYSSAYSSAGSANWKPSALLIISLCLSAVSAAWNVTRAIVFLVPLPSLRLTLAAGAFTLSALMIRCTSLVSLVVVRSVPELYFATGHNVYYLKLLGIYLPLVLVVPFIGYFLLTWEGTSELSCRTIANSTLRAAGFTYVDLSFGPLYPFVSVAQTSTRIEVSTKRFRNRLFSYAAYRLVVEITTMIVLVTKNWTPCLVTDWNALPGAVPYVLCGMMSCSLYKAALAGGLVVGVLSATAFMKFLARVSIEGSHWVYKPDGNTISTANSGYETLGISVDVINCFSSCSL